MGDRVLSRPCRKPVLSHSHNSYIRLKANKEITYFVATGTDNEFCRFKEEPLFYHRLVESFKFAYAARSQLGDPLGDPDIADTVASLVANLTSHTWGRDRYSQRVLNDL